MSGGEEVALCNGALPRLKSLWKSLVLGVWYELVCSLLSYNDDVGEDFVDLRKIVLDFS